ncbi:U-box domain-containing protein 36 [Nymphaea thermarum]|nr:U-box domain-containing protein 36 [Nymphaea thermarum]
MGEAKKSNGLEREELGKAGCRKQVGDGDQAAGNNAVEASREPPHYFLCPITLVYLRLETEELGRLERKELGKDQGAGNRLEMEELGRDHAAGNAAAEASREPPHYFLCPITLEIMNDPHVAADGYKYEKVGRVKPSAGRAKRNDGKAKRSDGPWPECPPSLCPCR